MLRRGYQMLVQNVQLLTTRQLVNLIRTPVHLPILCNLWLCASNLTVSECARVVLMHPGTLAIIEYAVI